MTILGTARRNHSGCERAAEIELTRSGTKKYFPLPKADRQHFAVVDYSPDGSKALIASERYLEYPNEQHRNVEVAVVPLASGQMSWTNAWDIFDWIDCDAMVEPQGFSPEGDAVIRVRKSVMRPPRRPDCVADTALYSIDQSTGKATRLPDSTKIARYGKEIRPEFQDCKSDPDIVGECFSVHGRLSAWNGTPTMRIWRIGTKRILGVHDGIMPESLSEEMNWDVDAFGDYLVCPFSKQKPSEMQSVCIETARNVVIRKRE